MVLSCYCLVAFLLFRCFAGGAEWRGQCERDGMGLTVRGRITYAIVALPIALVTSWVLWERGGLAFFLVLCFVLCSGF